jgi:hypothetical protein
METGDLKVDWSIVEIRMNQWCTYKARGLPNRNDIGLPMESVTPVKWLDRVGFSRDI